MKRYNKSGNRIGIDKSQVVKPDFFKRHSSSSGTSCKKEKNIFTTHSLDKAKQNTVNKVQRDSAII